MAASFRLLPALMVTAGALFALKAAGIVTEVSALLPASAIAQEAKPGAKPAAKPAAPVEAADAGVSDSEMSVLRDLSRRRQVLDKRESDLATREQYLQVAEKRVDSKINQMKALQAELKTLVGQAEAKENERLQSLVKIYETMKPKDAARIFQKLDLKDQIEVAKRMKEAKIAPVLAAMNDDAAKALTAEMVSRARLPQPGS